jgi:hypothetical protein
MKGTQTLKVSAAFFQCHMTPNNLDDIDAIQ